MTKAVAHARRCAEHYRRLGLCPLPSRSDSKAPDLSTYAEHYDGTPVPEDVYGRWHAHNIQIITGAKSPTPTKLLVVDCDGIEAMETWARILEHHGDDASGTWTSRTGSGSGMHTYFLLPASVSECPSGIVWGQWDTWRKAWVKHREIRIMADRALVVAPPSLHVDTGRPYEFMHLHSPRTDHLPRFAPGWLLEMKRLPNPIFELPPVRQSVPRQWEPKPNGHYSTEDVLAAISDKLTLAREWGVVFRGRPSPTGWMPCFVPGREEPERSHPSGGFNLDSGRLRDCKDGTSISLFDLGVVTGRFYTWQDCCNTLGDRYCRSR